MRYDDPERPKAEFADSAPLQTNGAPMPVISLIRPIETEEHVGWECGTRTNEEAHTHCMHEPSDTCPGCIQLVRPVWGWLACIHAANDTSRFGYYTGIISNLAKFHEEFLTDPEATLLRVFKYSGPEPRRARPQVAASVATVDGLWED